MNQNNIVNPYYTLFVIALTLVFLAMFIFEASAMG